MKFCKESVNKTIKGNYNMEAWQVRIYSMQSDLLSWIDLLSTVWNVGLKHPVQNTKMPNDNM